MRRRHKGRRTNALSIDETTWELRGQGATLVLRDEISDAIGARFQASNEQLAALCSTVSGLAHPEGVEAEPV